MPKSKELIRFLELPCIETFASYFRSQTGEHNYIDYKKEWTSDGKLAKDILGFANSGGGAIIVGITENADKSYNPDGLNELRDHTQINDKIKKYLPPELEYDVFDLEFPQTDEYGHHKGKMFQAVVIDDAPESVPFVSCNKKEGELDENSIYCRRGTSTSKASNKEIKDMFERRMNSYIESINVELFSSHLSQLKELYSNISAERYESTLKGFIFAGKRIKNEYYPEESIDEFISKMIEIKKSMIEQMVRKR
jgi:predicted HTH transcriptional regulator